MQVNELTACCNPAKIGIEPQVLTLCLVVALNTTASVGALAMQAQRKLRRD